MEAHLTVELDKAGPRIIVYTGELPARNCVAHLDLDDAAIGDIEILLAAARAYLEKAAGSKEARHEP